MCPHMCIFFIHLCNQFLSFKIATHRKMKKQEQKYRAVEYIITLKGVVLQTYNIELEHYMLLQLFICICVYIYRLTQEY